MTSTAVGVDGWRGGWVAIALEHGSFSAAVIASELHEIISTFPAATIGVDIPIGLPQQGARRADLAAREVLGPRRASVFLSPPRQVLEASDYSAARSRARRYWDRGITAQSYALAAKILETDALVQRGVRLHEVHPEVCFWAMARRPMEHGKRAWAGQRRRIALLAEHGIVLPDELGVVGTVPPDDILDAAAAAWTAGRIAAGVADRLPADPSADDPVIWY